MQHIDDDLLALIALDAEEPDDRAAAHLAGCAQCRSELDDLGRVVAAARSGAADQQLSTPPQRVWDSIAATVGHHGAAAPAQGGRDQSSSSAAVTDTAAPSRGSSPRRRTPTWLAVAAGVAIGAAGVGAAVSVTGSDETDRPAAQVVARADLAAFGDTGTPGEAAIRQTSEGQVLDVRIDDRTPGGGFREVWLLDAETGRLVSLGVLNGTESRFTLPAGLELGDYSTVDISREPLDGDPTHSTDSIARGDLAL